MKVEKFLFAGTEYIIVDKFIFDNIEYMYIFEDISKKINKDENVDAKADFVFLCEDGKYENVTDEDLYIKLMQLVNKRNMTYQSEQIEKYFTKND